MPEEEEISRFVGRFQRAWRTPTLLFHDELWSDEVELHQPLLGSLHGRDDCRRAFSKLFRLFPDLTAEVDGWTSDSNSSLFVSLRFTADLGGSPLTWPAVDRFLLNRTGTIVRRDSTFDPTIVLFRVLRSPTTWTRALQARLAPRHPQAPPWPSPEI